MNLMIARFQVSRPGHISGMAPVAKRPLAPLSVAPFTFLAALALMVTTILAAPAAADSPAEDALKATVGDGIAAAREGRFREAIAIWEPHAADDNPVAHYGLGLLYAADRGPDMPARPTLSHLHYDAAARKGHVGAIFELAFQFERGVGTDADINRAVSLYRIAARKNHLNAQYNLAVLLSQGGEIKANLREAYFWIMAAQHNASVRPRGELTFEKVSQLARLIRSKLPHQIASKASRAATSLTGQPI